MVIDQIIRLTLVSLLFIGTCVNNGSIAMLIYRFQTLRTIPNFFLLSSCIVDVLAVFCNLPGFVAGYIFRDTTFFVGRTLSLVISTSHVFFTLLNLFSLTLLMADKLCAFKMNISYRAWRTTTKARRILVTKWFCSFALSCLLMVPIWNIDLGDAPTFNYRQEHFKARGKYMAVIIIPLVITNNIVVATMTCRTIKHENRINTRRMNDDRTSNERRKQNEIKAIGTIGITVMLYFVSYLPAVIYSYLANINIVVHESENDWFGFICLSALFVPGFFNPIIFALRTKRFRRALKLLTQDPLGSSELTTTFT